MTAPAVPPILYKYPADCKLSHMFGPLGLKEVISFAKRKRALEKRFKKVKIAEGQVSHSSSPHPVALVSETSSSG